MTTNFRTFLILLAILFLIWIPIIAISATLTPEEQETCAGEGGCAVVSRKWVNERLAEAYAAGKKYSDVTCGKRSNYPFD